MPRRGERYRGDPAAVPRADKVRHVLRAGQKGSRRSPSSGTRLHHCHWPGCERQVPPAMWGCKRHWFLLPKWLRDRVWLAYRPGQEVNRTPSREYLAVALAVQVWVRTNYGEEVP